MGLFLGPLFCSIYLYVCLSTKPHTLDYYNYIMSWHWVDWFLPLYSFFTIVLTTTLFSLPFRINFRITMSVYKNITGILIGIALNQYINLRRIGIFTMLSLSVHEYGVSLHLFTSLISFITCLVIFSVQVLDMFC